MQVNLLYGTETSTAEMLCEDLEKTVGSGVSTCVIDIAEVAPDGLSPEEFHVLVTSTYGSGDLPANAQIFYDNLARTKPDLSAVKFAIFGLGDRSFGDTFNNGSQQLMDKMLELGAQMVGERGIFDASGPDMPEDVAVPWLRDVLSRATS